jgi:hypothetical protein
MPTRLSNTGFQTDHHRSGQRGPLEEGEEDTKVAKTRHSGEQIPRALRQPEGSTSVADACREHGIRRGDVLHLEEEVFGLGLSELREAHHLRLEVARARLHKHGK